MINKNSALILEGGGSRGAFTVGVLDFFLEKNIEFPYVIGVSAGAVNAINFVSKQRGRARQTSVDLCNREDIISFKNIFTNKSIFDLELLFDKLPNEIIPFDYDKFFSSETKCLITTTSCETGEAIYFEERKSPERLMDILKASTALPFLTHMIEIDNELYLDGGVADSIPLLKAQKDGYSKNIIVSTKYKGYRKSESKIEKNMAILFYNRYPNLVKKIVRRYKYYNKLMDYIDKLEEKGDILVIRPNKEFDVSRTEKSYEPLMRLCQHGQDVASSKYDEIMNYLYEK